MSLGIVIKGPEGAVLAAESRLTLTAKQSDSTEIHVNFDNAAKVLSFSDPHKYIGAVTYGLAAIGMRTAKSFIPEFEVSLPDERIKTEDYVGMMRDFFTKQWDQIMPKDYKGPEMVFLVIGFDEGNPYSKLFEFKIPSTKKTIEHFKSGNQFGLNWGGQREFVDRLLKGYDGKIIDILKKILSLDESQIKEVQKEFEKLQMQVPLQAMPLQDCVDLAIFFIRTTISAQNLTVGVRGCGGFIDVATITRVEGLKFIQRKKIHGEKSD